MIDLLDLIQLSIKKKCYTEKVSPGCLNFSNAGPRALIVWSGFFVKVLCVPRPRLSDNFRNILMLAGGDATQVRLSASHL